MIFRKLLLFVGMCVLFFASNSFCVHAQEQLPRGAGIQISPVRFDWELNSGDVKSDFINVKNYTNEKRTIKVSAENFFVSSDSEHANLFGGDVNHQRHAFNVIDWITFPEKFVLEAGEAKDIDFTVRVPDDQPTNGYYGAILFQTTDDVEGGDADGESTKIGIEYRVGTMVTLAVTGESLSQMRGAVDRFESTHHIYFDVPVNLIAEISNDGNTHYKMGGKIVIERFGKKFAVVDIGKKMMYPDAMRTFANDIPFDTWDFGVYKAYLTLASEHGDVALESATKNYYVLPQKGLVYSGIGFLGVVCIVFLFKYLFQISIRSAVTGSKLRDKRDK